METKTTNQRRPTDKERREGELSIEVNYMILLMRKHRKKAIAVAKKLALQPAT